MDKIQNNAYVSRYKTIHMYQAGECRVQNIFKYVKMFTKYVT